MSNPLYLLIEGRKLREIDVLFLIVCPRMSLCDENRTRYDEIVFRFKANRARTNIAAYCSYTLCSLDVDTTAQRKVRVTSFRCTRQKRTISTWSEFIRYLRSTSSPTILSRIQRSTLAISMSMLSTWIKTWLVHFSSRLRTILSQVV